MTKTLTLVTYRHADRVQNEYERCVVVNGTKIFLGVPTAASARFARKPVLSVLATGSRSPKHTVL